MTRRAPFTTDDEIDENSQSNLPHGAGIALAAIVGTASWAAIIAAWIWL